MSLRHVDPSGAAVDPLTALHVLAERQLGMASRAQAHEVGVDAFQVRHLVRAGRWQAIGTHVLRLVGSPRSDLSAALAGVLDGGAGAVLSHTSAAALWGVPGFFLLPVHVSVPRREHSRCSTLASVHRHRLVVSAASTVLDGVPVLRPEATMIQLCGMVHPQRAARALDRLWSDRLLSGPSVHRLLDQVAAKGLTGVSVLRDLLAARGPDYVPPASGLEARFAQVLEDAGLPEMRRQVDLGSGSQWCGRVDFRDTTLPLVVEVNSERYHSALTDVVADAARRGRLEEAGFVVVEVTDLQVWHRKGEVIAAVLDGRRRAATGPRQALPVLGAKTSRR